MAEGHGWEGSDEGGSGYVSSINVSPNFPELTVRVGGPGEKSTIGTPDQLLLLASPGGDAIRSSNGGRGYSGGGWNAEGERMGVTGMVTLAGRAPDWTCPRSLSRTSPSRQEWGGRPKVEEEVEYL